MRFRERAPDILSRIIVHRLRFYSISTFYFFLPLCVFSTPLRFSLTFALAHTPKSDLSRPSLS